LVRQIGRIQTTLSPAWLPTSSAICPIAANRSLLARIIEDPAIRLAHEGAFA